MKTKIFISVMALSAVLNSAITNVRNLMDGLQGWNKSKKKNECGLFANSHDGAIRRGFFLNKFNPVESILNKLLSIRIPSLSDL